MKNLSLVKITMLFLAICFCGFIQAAPKTQDPFEPINRKIYKFNKTIDAMYIKPISMTYSKVMPKPIKHSVGNFFSNIKEVPSSINHIFQGKIKAATVNFLRLLFNTTFGLGGIFDVATPMGFAKQHTDLGQTLMHLGYTNTRYLVLPLFGPSTVRDGVGLIGNNFISPPYYFQPKWRNRYFASSTIHNRAYVEEEFADIMATAGIDEYILVRNAYLQRKQYLLDNNDNAENKVLLQGPPE